MNKIQPFGIIVILLNVIVIPAAWFIGAQRFGWVETSLVLLVLPLFCLSASWLRVKRAPGAVPSNMVNIVALLIACLMGVSFAFFSPSNWEDRPYIIVAALIMFFTFSADIVVENLRRP